MTAVVERVKGLSRASKVLLVGIVLLVLLGASGVLRADNDVTVSSERAIEIASQELDFEAEQTAVKLVREGIGLHPVWAVSFSIPGTGGVNFERLLVVTVDAQSGEIRSISRQ
jgi:hypothetical protein